MAGLASAAGVGVQQVATSRLGGGDLFQRETPSSSNVTLVTFPGSKEATARGETSDSNVGPTRSGAIASSSSAAEAPSAPATGATAAARRQARRAALAAPVKLTDAAAARITTLLAKKPGAVGVRLGVRTRGCNGLSYTLDYVTAEDAKKAGEEVVESHGVRVVIDPKALIHILGTTMDFKDDALSSEFVFNNPNAKGACGCGESFNV